MKKIAIIISFIILLLIIGTYLIISNINDKSRSRYVSGELHVLFNETVNRSRAEDIIKEYNLTIKVYPRNNIGPYKIEIPNGEERNYIDLLKKHPEIKEVLRVYVDP